MSLNQVILDGNLTRDAEFSPPVEDKKALIVLSVATNDRYYQDGEERERTDYHRVVAFGRIAERLAELPKGHGLFVRGRLQTRKFEQDDEVRYITEVVGNYIVPTFGPSRRRSEGG